MHFVAQAAVFAGEAVKQAAIAHGVSPLEAAKAAGRAEEAVKAKGIEAGGIAAAKTVGAQAGGLAPRLRAC